MMVTYPSSNIKKNTYDILIYWLMLLIFFFVMLEMGWVTATNKGSGFKSPKLKFYYVYFLQPVQTFTFYYLKHRKVRV